MSKSLILSFVAGIACLSMDTAAAYSMEAYCNKVMSTPSKEWIAKQKDTLEAINRYSDCYLGKLDDTLRQLNTSDKGPLMGANGDFRDMSAALQKFTDAGLAATQANEDHIAYVKMYQQQFRNYFYQNYQLHPVLSKTTPEQVSVAKAIFEKVLNQLPQQKSTELGKLFNDFYNEASDLGIPKIAIYRHGAFVLQKAESRINIPAPF